MEMENVDTKKETSAAKKKDGKKQKAASARKSNGGGKSSHHTRAENVIICDAVEEKLPIGNPCWDSIEEMNDSRVPED